MQLQVSVQRIHQMAARRALSTIQRKASAHGSLTPFKKKIIVYRHLSPFEVSPISSVGAWAKAYKSKAVENYHWCGFLALVTASWLSLSVALLSQSLYLFCLHHSTRSLPSRHLLECQPKLTHSLSLLNHTHVFVLSLHRCQLRCLVFSEASIDISHDDQGSLASRKSSTLSSPDKAVSVRLLAPLVFFGVKWTGSVLDRELSVP